MHAEVTWAQWEAHRAQVLGLEGACPGALPESGAPDLPAVGGAEIAVVGDEGRAFGLQRGFDHRVASAGDLEGATVVDCRLAPVFLVGEGGEGGGDVDFGERMGGDGQGGSLAAMGMAVLPFLVLFSSNGRGYTLLTCFTLLLAIAIVRLLKNPDTASI